MGLRNLAWRSGTPVRSVLIAFILVYRATLSGWLGGQCRFSPTCSHYAEGAIREHGAVRGLRLATWRLARCNPYSRGGLDPVPAAHGDEYDGVLRHGGEARA